ncbi:antibiotic biosynthesis monooxygenase [Lutibacter sp.]|uniref:antibiotic biosynthesis monooxygenase family protein n=1 Tax=Lutibacter sp. TaxID=1925666 RepID=UPI003568DAE5
MIANTPKPPYYAVIFTTYRTDIDEGYFEMAEKMEKLAALQEGFLGVESARNQLGITISYWSSLEAIKNWKHNLEHSEAREKGRSTWYKKYKLRISKVERDYEFEK